MHFNGSLSKPIPVENGVKQGDIPVPTLFSIYFAVMLSYAFHDCGIGYTFALEPLAKSLTFVVSIPSRELFSHLSENSSIMHISLPIQKRACC